MTAVSVELVYSYSDLHYGWIIVVDGKALRADPVGKRPGRIMHWGSAELARLEAARRGLEFDCEKKLS